MVTMVTWFKRKPGMSIEEFGKYWSGPHAELVLTMPGFHRYHQCHTLPGIYKKTEPVYDGVALLWFENGDAVREMSASKAAQEVLVDEKRFIDHSYYGSILTDEHLIKEGEIPDNAVLNIEFVHKKPALALEAFRDYWREQHGPLAAKIPHILRYIQCHTRLGIYRAGKTPAYDGVALTWFASTDSMRSSAETPAYQATREDENNFLAPGPLPFIITRQQKKL